MAKQFGSQLDLQKIPVLNLVMQVSAAASPPAAPTNGQLWYDSTNNKAKVYESGSWVDIFSTAAAGGPAGGDLTGTYPNPQIAAGTIVDADIASANKDGTAGTPSLRTIGTGALQALAGNTRLDQVTAPTASVSLNSQKITNLADGTAANDAVSRQQLDAVAAGLDAKGSVRAATTANITLSGTQTVDGVALVAGDRCLVKNQTTASGNGIYAVASGAWTRSTDMDAWAEVPGAFAFVEEGTAQADTGWVCTANQGGTLNTTNITWTQYSAAVAVTAGAGLVQNAQAFDLVAGDTSLTVSADSVVVNTGVIATRAYADAVVPAGMARKYAADLGALSAGVDSANINHALNTSDVQAMFRVKATGRDVLLDWKVVDANNILVTPDVAYSAAALRVVVVG